MGFLAFIYRRKDMEEIGYEDVVQIQMAQDTVQLQDLVIMTIFCGSEIL